MCFEEESWGVHRRYLQPAFTGSFLDGFLPTYEKYAEKMASSMAQEMHKPFNVTKIINQCVLDVLLATVLGIEVEKNRESKVNESPYRKGRQNIKERAAKPWLMLDFIYRRTEAGKGDESFKAVVERYTRQALDDRRKNRCSAACILDHLLQIQDEHPDFTDADIIDEICSIMLGVRCAMTFFFYNDTFRDKTPLLAPHHLHCII